MIIDWTNTEVTGISGIRIDMPNEAKILILQTMILPTLQMTILK